MAEVATTTWSTHSSPPPREPGTLRTLLVAVAICAVCSLAVSATAVLLRPLHRASRERERQAAVLALVARQPGLEGLLSDVGAGEVHDWIIDLASGQVATWIDASQFDAVAASQDPLRSTAIPAQDDIAGLGRRANFATAYAVVDASGVQLLVLPVHGQGYGGLMYGHVALAGDANTVVGLSFHRHAETPGVGGSMLEDEEWLAEWRGKLVRDESDRLRIGIANGDVDPDSEQARHEIDAVSGATKTCGGVAQLLRYWLGDDGFGPFLARVRSGEALR